MDEVKLHKSELLEKLKANRDSHTQLYKDAVEGFKVVAKDKLEKALATLEKGSLPNSISFSQPVDHTQQYNEAISMLEMSVDEKITLRRGEFNSYVLDSWVSDTEKSMMRTLASASSNFANYVGK